MNNNLLFTGDSVTLLSLFRLINPHAVLETLGAVFDLSRYELII